MYISLKVQYYCLVMLSGLSKKALKQSIFQAFYSMKCFDINSQSIIMIIYVIRFISELVIINYSSIIMDPSFSYISQIYTMLLLTSSTSISLVQICILIGIFLICSGFFYFVFTFNKENANEEKIVMFLRFNGILVYTFRTLMVKLLGEIVFTAYNTADFIGFVFGVLVAIMIIVAAFMIQQFNIQISLTKAKKSAFSKSYHSFNGISEIIILFITVISPFIQNAKFQITVIINIVLIISYTLKILTSAFRKKYINELIQALQRLTCVTFIVYYLLIIPGKYVDLLTQNFMLTTLSIVIFVYKGFSNYIIYCQQQSIMFLDSLPKTKDQLLSRQTKFYLFQGHYLIHYVNYLMIQYKGQEEGILTCSILAEHFRQCKNTNCYCERMQNQNKNKAMMDLAFRGQFLLSFVENIYRQFNEEFDIFTLFVVFKLQIVGIFPDIQYALNKYQINNPSLKIPQQYIIFQIKKILYAFIDDKNRQMQSIKVERALIEQELSKSILQSLRQIVNFNIKKYKLLSQAICNLNSVQQNVQQTLGVIKKIQLKYLQSKARNDYNLHTQKIFFFYYTKICQDHSQVSQIINNIYVKTNYLKSLKGLNNQNFGKFLYDDKSCVFQSHLDPQNLGMITNLTQNCQKVFGFKKHQLFYKNIRKVIPKFLNQEHQTFLKQWLTVGSFRKVNKRIYVYLTNAKGVCFQAIAYLQICTSFPDRIKVYVMILKRDGDNYLMLDQNMIIQGYGQKIKQSVFSLRALRQPLSKFCINNHIIDQFRLRSPDQKKQIYVLFISDEKINLQDIKNNDLQGNIVSKIQQFAQKKLQSMKQFRVLRCKVTVLRAMFGRLQYFILNFVDTTELVLRHSQIQKLQTQFIKTDSQPFQQNPEGDKKFRRKKSQIKQQNKKGGQSEMKYLENHRQQEQSSGKQICGQDQQMQKMQYQQSISSMVSQQAGYSFKRLMKLIKQKFLFQKDISYRQLNIVTIFLIVLVVLLFSCLLYQYIFYRQELSNFKTIMIANQEVSTTLQNLQVMFSQVMLIVQNCNLIVDNVKCQNFINQAQLTYFGFYQKIVDQFSNLLKQQASTNFPFYIYLKQQIKVNFGRSQPQMTIHQFIQTFYYSMQKICVFFQTSTVPDIGTLNLLSFINDNWLTITQINHNILQLYQQNGLSQMSLISIVLYVITGSIALINGLVIFAAHYFISQSNKRKEVIVRNYQLVPVSFVEATKKYYEDVLQLIKHNDLKINQEVSFPTLQDNSYYRPKSQFFYSKSSFKNIIFLGFFFFGLTISNLTSLYQMNGILSPFQSIFIEESQMISASKTVIQSYFELKRVYLFEKNQTVRDQRLKILANRFIDSEVQFNRWAVVLLQQFADSSNNYKQDFKQLLISDICKLTKLNISSSQYSKCISSQSSFPSHGVFPTVIYIQRITTSAMLQLSNMSLNNSAAFFASSTYADVDSFTIYVYLVFDMLQGRISSEMGNFLQTAYLTCLLTIVFQIVFIIVGMVVWAYFYLVKTREFVGLYGHAMLFPGRIIKKNKKVMKDIENSLVLKQY